MSLIELGRLNIIRRTHLEASRMQGLVAGNTGFPDPVRQESLRNAGFFSGQTRLAGLLAMPLEGAETVACIIAGSHIAQELELSRLMEDVHGFEGKLANSGLVAVAGFTVDLAPSLVGRILRSRFGKNDQGEISTIGGVVTELVTRGVRFGGLTLAFSGMDPKRLSSALTAAGIVEGLSLLSGGIRGFSGSAARMQWAREAIEKGRTALQKIGVK